VSANLHAKIRRKALIAGGLLTLVLGIGTAVYKYIGGAQATLTDSLYMVVITIATIGYGEIIDLSHSPGGRIFTMFLSVTGIGIMTYIMMSLTAFVVEGELNEAFRRRKMDKRIEKLRDHYIVCGADGVGTHVARELAATKRPFIVVDVDREKIERLHGGDDGPAWVVGDATDNTTLEKAGIERAQGLFAVTGDDNMNMVISLSARQLNPKIRVVARCEEARNSDKMQRAGADSAVSPTRIGGLRMASEMLRPAVVNFLDVMLRREDLALRIEELPVPAGVVGRPLATLELHRFHKLLLLAVRTGEEDWTYNPSRDHVMQAGETLVFMGSPAERLQLEQLLGGPAHGA
jgi:voltage-gated potassium channel